MFSNSDSEVCLVSLLVFYYPAGAVYYLYGEIYRAGYTFSFWYTMAHPYHG